MIVDVAFVFIVAGLLPNGDVVTKSFSAPTREMCRQARAQAPAMIQEANAGSSLKFYISECVPAKLEPL